MALSYREQQLEFDGVALSSLVQDEQRPTYVYSLQNIERRIQQWSEGISQSLQQETSFHYAMKANANKEILKLFLDNQFGVDVVSGGELQKALEVGFLPEKVIFSGSGKTREEIRFALGQKIRQLNVESLPELKRVAELAKNSLSPVPIVLRVNPSVDPQTHPYISTGFKENKFGIEESAIGECLQVFANHPRLRFVGLSCHIGSQLLDFQAFQEALEKIQSLVTDLRALGYSMERLDVGGGVGIDYQQDEGADAKIFQSYQRALAQGLGWFDGVVQFEPGRFLVARSGILLTQVQYIKKTTHRNFVICHSGMHHLMRPALYQAYHRIFQIQKRAGEKLVADVVGPICESSDFFGKQRLFEGLHEGDWLGIAEAGAYGASMASLYNAFELPLEVLLPRSDRDGKS